LIYRDHCDNLLSFFSDAQLFPRRFGQAGTGLRDPLVFFAFGQVYRALHLGEVACPSSFPPTGQGISFFCSTSGQYLRFDRVAFCLHRISTSSRARAPPFFVCIPSTHGPFSTTALFNCPPPGSGFWFFLLLAFWTHAYRPRRSLFKVGAPTPFLRLPHR